MRSKQNLTVCAGIAIIFLIMITGTAVGTSTVDSNIRIEPTSIQAFSIDGMDQNESAWTTGTSRLVLRAGQIWELEDGYNLTVIAIDVWGDKGLINLHKNGELVDQHIVPAESRYYYNRTSVDGKDQVIITTYITDVFQGQRDSLIVFEPIEQYSDTGTVDYDPTRLLGSEEIWDLGNGYSLKFVDIEENGRHCMLFLEKNGVIVDKRILDENDVYIYQRRNESNSDIETILGIPIINTFGSTSGDYVEFPNDYSLRSDANTVDIDPFLLIESGKIWDLNNGYSITVDEVSPNKKALITLEKEDVVIDRYIIDENSNYSYDRLSSNDGSICQIININPSKIFNGKYNDYVEFYSEYKINPDIGTVALDEKIIISLGQTLELKEGYTLTLISTDIKGDDALINLIKNGQLVDEHILKTGEHYYFNRSVNGNDQVIISFLLDRVFTGEMNKLVILKDIIQNPDITTDELIITRVQKDTAEIRGPVYNGTSLEDIVGNNDSDFIEMNALNFAGLYYDIDTGVSTENLRIFGGHFSNESTIEKNGLIYTTMISSVNYESDNLEGQYNVIGFFGDKYVPLTANAPDKFVKLLLDSNEKLFLRTGQPLELPDGYVLEAKAIDVEGKKVWMELSRNGIFIEDEVIDVSDKNSGTWTCDIDFTGGEEVVVMKINITGILQENTSWNGMIMIDGLWLVDFENIVQIQTANQFGEMGVDYIGPDYIKMTNQNPINLTKGSVREITNDLSFKIAGDEENLRFHLMKEHKTLGVHELRGTVAEDVTEFEWNPLNFGGFYYDIEEGVGTESLEILNIDGRSIGAGDLLYSTSAQKLNFEHKDWGQFEFIGFMGEKYFAGYPHNEFTDSINILSNGKLSKMLINDGEKQSVNSGSILDLEEGYSLDVVEIDVEGNTVFVSLKNGNTEVDSGIVSANDDYVYKKDLGSSNEIPIIVVHFGDIFMQNESKGVFVDGIFQISENCTTLNNGDVYGNMEITSLSSVGITMENSNDIHLLQDTTIPVTENIQFEVADDIDNVRFYPFIEVEIAFDPFFYDMNHDDIIEKSEVINAIEDYFDDKITKDNAIEVIVEYFR